MTVPKLKISATTVAFCCFLYTKLMKLPMHLKMEWTWWLVTSPPLLCLRMERAISLNVACYDCMSNGVTHLMEMNAYFFAL